MLTNPFYAGIVSWDGQSYQGAHQPMVTKDAFAQIARRLGRKLDKLPPRKQILFPFKGLMRCGECGLSITAENKINRYGYHYTYYHCTRKRVDYLCKQRAVSGTALHDSFVEFLEEHTLPKSLHAWSLRKNQRDREHSGQDREHQERALRAADADAKLQFSRLMSLSVRGLIPDTEFLAQKSRILNEREEIAKSLTRLEKGDGGFEPAASIFSFNDRALFWYTIGDSEAKWQISRAMSSNLILRDKKVSIEAADPFTLIKKNADRSMLCAALDRIRTLYQSGDKDFLQILSIIKHLQERFRNQPDPHIDA